MSNLTLNGWQRLWTVGAVLWTLFIASFAWSSWPQREGETVSVFWSGMTDPKTGAMPEVDFFDAAAHLTRWSAWESGPKPSWADSTGRRERFIPVRDLGQLFEVPLVGNVRFPVTMSSEQVGHAVKTMSDEHQQIIMKINRASREAFASARRSSIQNDSLFWLLPLIAAYSLGWSVSWVRRGFSAPTQH